MHSNLTVYLRKVFYKEGRALVRPFAVRYYMRDGVPVAHQHGSALGRYVHRRFY